MPLPASELAAWKDARVTLDGQVLDELPLRYCPVAYVLSAQAPQGVPGEGDDDRHAALLRSLRQAGRAFHEVELGIAGRAQAAVLVPGMTRARAVQLAYKRKQWAVLELRKTERFVVYTGINSRM